MKITICTDEGDEYSLRQFRQKFRKLQRYTLMLKDLEKISKLNPKDVEHRTIFFSRDWPGFDYLIEEKRLDTDIIDTYCCTTNQLKQKSFSPGFYN